MTLHEMYVSLFWIVIGGYVAYLGWTVYRVATERAARARHPSRKSDRSTPQLSRSPFEGGLQRSSSDDAGG